LISASAELFDEGIPALVTVREIAQRANVNQGLVHEYFGSKDALIAATIEDLARQRAEIVADAPDEQTAVVSALRFQQERPAYTRLLAWWLLEGRDIGQLDLHFGPIREIVDNAYGPGSRGTKIDRQVVAAGVALMMLGAVVFRGFVDAHILTDEISDEQFTDQLARLASSLHEWNWD
jgi:AcrR family transcriptional regulator